MSLDTGPKPRPSPWELAVAPPPEQWDEWWELDPAAWPERRERLLTGKLRPDGAPPDAPELPAQSAQRESWGWPRHVFGLGSGGGFRTNELGQTSYTLAPMPFNPTTLELDEGLYCLGAQARAKDGNLAFPIGTGLARVKAGEHRLRFELGPSGAVEGRVSGIRPEDELCVALARKGELLELDVRRSEVVLVEPAPAWTLHKARERPASPRGRRSQGDRAASARARATPLHRVETRPQQA